MLIHRFICEKIRTFKASQSGTVATATAIMLTVLLGCASLGVDLGHLILVKSEMQRAADAGALAGARALVPYTTSAGTMNNSTSDPIDKSAGAAAASTTISANKADGHELTNPAIKADYWNLTSKDWTTDPSNLTAQDVPAVKVSITKAGDENNGPVRFALGAVLGKESADVKVESVAILPGAPGSIQPGGAFPFVVPKNAVMANNTVIGNLWNQTVPNPGHYTSFKTVDNGASNVANLLKTGNPSSLAIGDQIYIPNGNMTSLFGANNIGKFIGKTVFMPVVDQVTTGQKSTIVGFIAFKIEAVNKQGNDNYIAGKFIKDYVAPGSATSANAPYLGTYASTPKLIQ